MSLNNRLMKLYNFETACQATYQKDGSTYHTLKYVDWLEERTTKLEELAQQHLTQGNRLEDSAQICPRCEAVIALVESGIYDGSTIIDTAKGKLLLP